MTDDDSRPTRELIDARYEILECVGQGGMARVYRAKDTLLGRIVAIKLLRAELEGDDASAGRARGEMTALASLNHPALVTLYDAQLEPGRAEYLVMEYVDGPTLADRIGQGALPPADVAALAADLAEALHVVHSAGIVHRDIKPSNVLISRAPFPASRSGAKLADFGISALVDAARLTSPGIVIGTAAYIAPEQLQGAMPAPPADIYSLGLVLLETLTGTRAFPQSEGIGAAMARLTARPEVPTVFGSGWSGLLSAMTSIDPADRPTASDVFAAASDLAAGRPPRPTVPAAVAAAALAAAAVSPAAASTTDAESPTAALATSTRMLPTESPAALAAGASSPPPQAGRGSSRPTRRRVGVIGTVAAAAVAASVLAGVWMTGSAAPEPVATTPTDTVPSAPATPAVPAIAPDDEADKPQTDQRSDQDRKAQEKAAKDAEKAAEQQRKTAEKAAEEQRKAAEKAAEKARKDAEKAQDAEEAEENQDDEAEPTPEGRAGAASEGVTLSSPQPSASPTA